MVLARQRAAQIAGGLAMPGQDQTRIATAVSEIARNAFIMPAAAQSVSASTPGRRLRCSKSSSRIAGPASRHLRARARRAVPSETGMGIGLAARAADGRFHDRQRGRAGTRHVCASSCRSARAARTRSASPADERLAAETPPSRSTEMQQQNRELIASLDELRDAPGGTGSSTASWRIPIAASWRSMRSSTKRPSSCGAPAR